MIFAEIQHPEHYADVHDELRDYLGRHFSQVQSGLQGDSWIEILDGGVRVVVDTFTSMQHQIKSPKAGEHVQRVLDVLQPHFKLKVYEKPTLEPHEVES